MNSQLARRAVLVGFAVLAAAAIALPALGSAESGVDRGTFTLFEHDTSDQSDNAGDPQTGVGNLFIFGGDVLDHEGGTQVGRMGGSCSNTSTTELLCTAAFTLSGGQIDFQGIANTDTFFGGQPTDFAITGGTGPYHNARGTITGVIQPDGIEAVFTVRLG